METSTAFGGRATPVGASTHPESATTIAQARTSRPRLLNRGIIRRPMVNWPAAATVLSESPAVTRLRNRVAELARRVDPERDSLLGVRRSLRRRSTVCHAPRQVGNLDD